MRFFLILWLALTSIHAGVIKKNDCKYYLSVCSMFSNEGPYLKEWIEFHRLVGVEHFYLYNNSSPDNYLEVLQPYIDSGLVDLIDWPSPPEIYVRYQVKAHNDCLKKCLGETYWLAIIDIDEFLVPVQTDTMAPILKKYEKENIGSLRINWQLYGTSYLKTLPKDKLMIESLILKAPWDYDIGKPSNLVVKSIVKPHAIEEYRIHEGDFKKGFHAMPKKQIDPLRQPIQIDEIRINHYFTRAEDFFYEVKIARRAARDDNFAEMILKKAEDFNQVEDKIMYRFVPKLREIMKVGSAS